MSAEFDRTTRAGDKGVRMLLARWPGDVMPPAHPWDVELTDWPESVDHCRGEGQLRVEVKTETRDPRRTPNVFIELQTATPDGRLLDGGPWRAAADGVDAMAYVYPVTGLTLWLWDLERACERIYAAVLADQDGDWRYRYIRHGRYGAHGWVVPRIILATTLTPNYLEEQP